MGKIKRIHVNQHNIKWNNKNPVDDRRSIMTIKYGGKTYIGNDVIISGESKVVYSPEKPLSCGAHVWIETHSEVTIDGIVLI